MAMEIRGTGKAVPVRRLSNGDLARKIDTSDEWIRSHTGIGARHIADEGTACRDLALEAAREALAMAGGWRDGDRESRDLAAGEAAKSLDLIVLATAAGFLRLPFYGLCGSGRAGGPAGGGYGHYRRLYRLCLRP